MNNTPDIHPSWGDLAAFELGRLSDCQWAVTADHLSRCDLCNSRLDTVPQDAFVARLRAPASRLLEPTPADASFDTPVATAAPASSQLPEALKNHPRYRVLELLGSGGMGMVFHAEHVLMGRPVALKVLHQGLLARPAAVGRFLSEVKALARLAHPNIVAAYDAEQVGEVLFLVMEYAEGESLDRILRRCGTLPVNLARDWIRQTAVGLQFAFENGLVHRDLKPANLLVTPQGQVKILDFGLARLLGETAGDSGRTPDGAVVGTLDYVAPEQARAAKTADIRADLYSLGCTWYEMLTGRPPFHGGTALQQLLAHQDQTPPPLAQCRPDVPAEMSAIVERLLLKDPAQRFQTPTEFLKALEKDDAACRAPVASQQPRRRRIGTLLGALSLLLVALAGLGWFGYRFLPVAASRNEGTPAPLVNNEIGSPREKEPTLLPPKKEKRRSAREQLVDWLKLNNAFRPDHAIVERNDRKLGADLAEGKAFSLWLSPQLVKSGQATVLAGRHDDFFTFNFDPVARPINDFGTITIVTANQEQAFHPDPPIILSNLAIDEKDNLDGDRPVTGSVTYRTLRPVSGDLAVRLTFTLGESYTFYWLLRERDRLADQGELPFRFSAPYVFSMEDPRPTGLNIMFVDVCSRSEMAPKDYVLSNTVAALVAVHDARARK